MIANFLLNEPIVSAFINTRQVLWATGVWYLIFYSPFDVAFKLCNFLPIKLTLYCADEIHNCKVIYQGITHSSRVFPDSYFVMLIIGIVRGNGQGFTQMLERTLRGNWSVSNCEFMHPSYSTKISALVTIVFILNRYCESLMISQSFILFCVSASCIYLRMSAIVMDLTDPFSPFENLLCLIFFGGIWDALSRALTIYQQSRHSRSSNMKGKLMRAEIITKNGRIDKIPVASVQ